MQQITPPSMKVVALPAPYFQVSHEEDYYTVKAGFGIFFLVRSMMAPHSINPWVDCSVVG
jgi:hypothetical protein